MKTQSFRILTWVLSLCLITVLSCKKEDAGKTIYQVEMSKGQAVAIDNTHGLMWQRDIDWKPYNFDERGKVLAYCENLEYGGFTDWKVPTIDEWKIRSKLTTQFGAK